MSKFLAALGAIILVVVGFVGLVFISSFVTRWAWNEAMPYLFSLPVINYWQALALNVLVTSLRGFRFKN